LAEAVELELAAQGTNEAPPVDGPALKSYANADAGDYTVSCSNCGQERDEPHTWRECAEYLASQVGVEFDQGWQAAEDTRAEREAAQRPEPAVREAHSDALEAAERICRETADEFRRGSRLRSAEAAEHCAELIAEFASTFQQPDWDPIGGRPVNPDPTAQWRESPRPDPFDAKIAAGPIALPICSRCNDTHEMPAWNGSGATWPCTGCPRPCDKATCRKSAISAFCDVTPCACACHADDHLYVRARAEARAAQSNGEEQKP